MEDSNDIIVLGAIRKGAKNFGKIRKQTKIDPEELNAILDKLEKRGLIDVNEKKGFLGKKIELVITEKGDKEVQARIHELEQNWQQLVSLYKSGDKNKLDEGMNGFRGMLPMMMFFGIMDIMMFSMMMNMMGAHMTDYVPAEQIPSDAGVSETGDMGDAGSGDHGGFDIDIGF